MVQKEKKWKRLPAGEFEKIILKKPTHGPLVFLSLLYLFPFSLLCSAFVVGKKVGKIVFRATTNNSIGFVFSLFRVSVRGCCCYSTLFKLKFKILCFHYKLIQFVFVFFLKQFKCFLCEWKNFLFLPGLVVCFAAPRCRLRTFCHCAGRRGFFFSIPACVYFHFFCVLEIF